MFEQRLQNTKLSFWVSYLPAVEVLRHIDSNSLCPNILFEFVNYLNLFLIAKVLEINQQVSYFILILRNIKELTHFWLFLSNGFENFHKFFFLFRNESQTPLVFSNAHKMGNQILPPFLQYFCLINLPLAHLQREYNLLGELIDAKMLFQSCKIGLLEVHLLGKVAVMPKLNFNLLLLLFIFYNLESQLFSLHCSWFAFLHLFLTNLQMTPHPNIIHLFQQLGFTQIDIAKTMQLILLYLFQNKIMRSSANFNIITGQVLKYQPQRKSSSLMQLDQSRKSANSYLSGIKKKLPPLGTAKDKYSFQYSYIDYQDSNEGLPHQDPKQKVLLNYTFQKRDPITHRRGNPNRTLLEHKDFQSKLEQANAKGILTHHIDKSRLYAPNFHQNFPQRVDRHEFHKKNRVCGMVAEIEKSYALGKYFRKLK